MKKQILIALIFAVLASVFVGLYLFDIGQKGKSMSEPVKVVVASAKIEQGAIINMSMLKEKLIPKEFVQPKYVSNMKDFYINDKPAYMAIISFEEGEQITAGKVLPITSDAGISNTIPDGKRAITLTFSRDEVYGIIMPGSRIDLISIIDYEGKDKTVIEASCVIAQNLLVLAVGNNIIGGINNTKQEMAVGNTPVTIAVSIKEAQSIFLAQEKGVIKTALRPTSDIVIEQITSVKINDIFTDAISKPVFTKQQNIDQKTLKEIQKNQKEAYEILSKYSSK
ncbi:MAG: Flp pilus assembly protein CpaB [Endomicrobiaceae bacterium]|nr:Flp pilus assembly protein CpaB [Endomicrobiaceae bacterium]